MEKELNIAAILKDKPCGLKLYDTIRKINVFYDEQVGKDCEIHCNDADGYVLTYSYNGTLVGFPEGMQILKPSKLMQDWSKFTWKKGDVLIDRSNGYTCMFCSWTTDEYIAFDARYTYYKGKRNYSVELPTMDFMKASDEEANEFIKKIEKGYGGKLNLETLEIEKPKPEFKDGDVLFVKTSDNEEVFIKKLNPKEKTAYYVSYNLTLKDFGCQWCKAVCREQNIKELRLATDSEKQQLFDALAKENKAWDAENKMLVDLPKKCEFETMDWCLMRDHREKWKLCQFGFFDKGDGYEAAYNAVGGNWYNECIPYNEETKHLLGTTDEWEGGEG